MIWNPDDCMFSVNDDCANTPLGSAVTIAIVGGMFVLLLVSILRSWLRKEHVPVVDALGVGIYLAILLTAAALHFLS